MVPLEHLSQGRRRETAQAGDASSSPSGAALEQPPDRKARGKLRRELKARRAALGSRERRRKASVAAHRLAQTRVFRRARRIAVYWAMGAELNTDVLMHIARKRGKTVLLPVLGTTPAQRLQFMPLEGSTLHLNRFGIPEPTPHPAHLVNPRFLDLVVVPLVGFDHRCQRLGMGGGFYDRTFAFLRRRRYWHTPRLVGFAYGCQQVEQLTAAPWDVPMDAVITETSAWCRGPGLV